MVLPAEIRDMEAWAADGGYDHPETVGIDRAEGWPVVYEQIGGRAPERLVFNNLLFELTTFWRFVRDHGVPLPWHSSVDYRHPAFVRGSDGAIYRSLMSSGPATGNNIDPRTPGQTIWRAH